MLPSLNKVIIIIIIIIILLRTLLIALDLDTSGRVNVRQTSLFIVLKQDNKPLQANMV